MPKRACKYGILFLIGAALYFEVELNFRYFAGTLPVHWSMPLLGGALFLMIGGLNNWLPWQMPLILQGMIGAALATVAEFLAGCVLNLWLKLDVWDYSGLPLNVLGQVSLPFSLAWVALATVAVVVDDVCRWKLFGDDPPHYALW